MEDATKATVKNQFGVQPDEDPKNVDAGGATAPEDGAELVEDQVQREDQTSTDERALDRWFLTQKGRKRVPKRLEVPNEVLVTSAGPFKITGNLTLIDEDGEVTHANHLTLCRCGASNNKPHCDDRHLEIEFFDMGHIHRASDCMPVTRPQTVTITCVKDGPLKFRGYMRVYNRKGQECLSMQGSLCRCGKSTNKPFCDCQ
jgi:CDGSH-type Zn-finger protein